MRPMTKGPWRKTVRQGRRGEAAGRATEARRVPPAVAFCAGLELALLQAASEITREA